MNAELTLLAVTLGLDDIDHEPERLRFGLACANHVRHLLEDEGAIAALAVLASFVDGKADQASLLLAREKVALIASGHPGSRSMDGAVHAAVSATHAVAHALAGRALQAASYSAYACVYAYSVHAVSDPSAYAVEFAWQIEQLESIMASRSPLHSLPP